jgi:putative transposase
LRIDQKRNLIESKHNSISINKQCELLGISRAAYYYKEKPVDEYELKIMRLIDEEYTRHPFFGSRRISDWLGTQGHDIGRDKVRSMMRLMGVEAVYPKPRLSTRNKAHKIYPYLLNGLDIDAPDVVWASDITYIPLGRNFAYLVVVMDWYSRYILSWRLSMSLDADFCVEALEDASRISTPTIFNTDQGCQYTSLDFTSVLKSAGIWISMDGKGRAFDNIIQERLWRTVKYEDVYLHDYTDYITALNGLDKYIEFYNCERRHTSLGRETPHDVYYGKKKGRKNAA